MYVCILYSYIFFLKKLLSALFVPVSVAAPVYQTEMSFTPFEKNMVHEIEDRNNPALVNQIATYAFMANLIFLVYKWRIIFCVIDPTTCGSTNIITTNVHMYETLETPHILAATDMIMSNLSPQNVVPFSMIDLTSAKSDSPAVFEQNPFRHPDLKVRPVTQTETTTQHNIDFQEDTIRALNYVHPSFPVHNIIAPYSKFRWPMYPNYGRILRPHSDFLLFDRQVPIF
jgi:hypothetical protein